MKIIGMVAVGFTAGFQLGLGLEIGMDVVPLLLSIMALYAVLIVLELRRTQPRNQRKLSAPVRQSILEPRSLQAPPFGTALDKAAASR